MAAAAVASLGWDYKQVWARGLSLHRNAQYIVSKIQSHRIYLYLCEWILTPWILEFFQCLRTSGRKAEKKNLKFSSVSPFYLKFHIALTSLIWAWIATEMLTAIPSSEIEESLTCVSKLMFWGCSNAISFG